MSNLGLRVLTALIGVPIILGAVYWGGLAFVLLLTLAGVVAQWELYQLMRKASLAPLQGAGLALGILVGLRSVLPWSLALTVALAVVLLAVGPLRKENASPLTAPAVTLFGVLYPTFMLTALANLRQYDGLGWSDAEAMGITIAFLFLIWATDTFAYFVGKTLGRHPLAPRVSPKKTWEGAVGGAVGALLIGSAFKLAWLSVLTWGDVLALVLICGVFSQLGDLAESQFKRAVGVKDASQILPGHGGVLDRVDALILAAPLAYLYFVWLAPYLR